MKFYAVICATFIIFIFFLLSNKIDHPYQISIAAVFQNEERFLQEWIEYHKVIGVEHFYLFNHFSTDRYLEVLNPYIAKGEVELYDWPYPYETVNNKGIFPIRFLSEKEKDWTSIQAAAYRKALDLARGKTKWLAIIDTDEFIVMHHKKNLADFLKDYENFGGVFINWQVFGTSHVARIPDERWMIETLILKTPADYPINRLCKSIVRPERVRTCINSHSVIYYPWYYGVNASKNIFQWEHHLDFHAAVSDIQINHYWARDEEFFVKDRLNRYQKWGLDCGPCIQRNADANLVEDKSIFPFVSLMPQKKGSI